MKKDLERIKDCALWPPPSCDPGVSSCIFMWSSLCSGTSCKLLALHVPPHSVGARVSSPYISEVLGSSLIVSHQSLAVPPFLHSVLSTAVCREFFASPARQISLSEKAVTELDFTDSLGEAQGTQTSKQLTKTSDC